jgi:hypothetical protein
VIDVLAATGQPTPIDVEALLARARALRPLPPAARLTPRQLRTWKNAGRL